MTETLRNEFPFVFGHEGAVLEFLATMKEYFQCPGRVGTEESYLEGGRKGKGYDQ